MKQFKVFSEQFRECNNNGNCISVHIPKLEPPFDTELICVKYRKICRSDVCKNERMLAAEMNIDEQEEH